MKLIFLTLITLFSFIFQVFSPETQTYNYALDESKSVIEWSGASPNTSHQGSFGVTSSGIQVEDGTIKGGSFVIPIASIKNFDLPKTIKPVLLKHLKSKDFFNIALYPEASFTITQVVPLVQASAGAVAGANMLVTGNFTMLGQTHPITFPARIAMQDDAVAIEATFKLDRTKWGMNYAADPALKNRHIYPEVDIHLKLAANRNEG
jgi:polyisoprenoid-binding protein YceI